MSSNIWDAQECYHIRITTTTILSCPFSMSLYSAFTLPYTLFFTLSIHPVRLLFLCVCLCVCTRYGWLQRRSSLLWAGGGDHSCDCPCGGRHAVPEKPERLWRWCHRFICAHRGLPVFQLQDHQTRWASAAFHFMETCPVAHKAKRKAGFFKDPFDRLLLLVIDCMCLHWGCTVAALCKPCTSASNLYSHNRWKDLSFYFDRPVLLLLLR